MQNIIQNKKVKNLFEKKILGSKMLTNIANYLHNNVKAINQSKIFAGLMIIILNIASKFVTIQLPKTVESYLKFTFSRDLLVFAIAWMGTRDIYIALGIVCIFIFIVDFLCNEKSAYCVLPETFVDLHVDKLDEMNNSITAQDLQNIKNIAKKIEKEFESIEETIEKKPEVSVINPNMGFIN
jgi:hypothetical protein